MRVTSIDPGLKTGYCTLDFDHILFSVKRLKTLGSAGLQQAIKGFIYLDNPDVLIIEQLPPFFEKGLQEIVSSINSVLPNFSGLKVERINPGNWKPVAKAQKWAVLHGDTTHEKDAYCMARFYLWKHQGEKVK